MPKDHHILNAASNLLGISLVIIAGLHISSRSGRTLADEVAWVAALCFSLSCLTSYLSIRSTEQSEKLEVAADRLFLTGMFALIGSVTVLAVTNI